MHNFTSFAKWHLDCPRYIRDLITLFQDKLFNKLLIAQFWVAGGAVRDMLSGDKPRDFDLFFPAADTREAVKLALLSEPWNGKITKQLPNAIHIELPATSPLGAVAIDLVGRYFANPTECIAQFDFTINCVAISADGFFFHHRDFFVDKGAQRLIVNKLPFPADSLRRMVKYVKRGFSICPEELQKLCSAIRSSHDTVTVGGVTTAANGFYLMD